MSEVDALKLALRGDEKAERRALRAARTRAQALSPVRILMQVLLIPVATVAITISIYVRTSPYERTDAMRHLAAIAGCDTARAVGLAPAFEGEIGYHKRNDPDGDGVACGPQRQAMADAPQAPVLIEPEPDAPRIASGAKFLRP